MGGFRERIGWLTEGRQSLPGALGAYALGIGVDKIGERLPLAAYALLSGLNGATVGIVAVAAVSGFVFLVFVLLQGEKEGAGEIGSV